MIIIAVIIAVGILLSFRINAKSAKKNINGIIVMALAGVCAFLLMLFGFMFSSFTIYLLFVILVAVLLLMLFLLLQYIRNKKEKASRAYADGNAGSPARKIVSRVRETSSYRTIPSDKSLQGYNADYTARKISVEPVYDTADYQGGLSVGTQEPEITAETEFVPVELETTKAFAEALTPAETEEPSMAYEAAADETEREIEPEDLPAAIAEEIDSESVQEAPEIGIPEQEEFVPSVWQFEPGLTGQAEAPEDALEEAETEPVQYEVEAKPAESLMLSADETAEEEWLETVQPETLQEEEIETEELQETEEEPSSAAPYEILQEEDQPEETQEILQPEMVQEEEIESEELQESTEPSAAADMESFDIRREEEIQEILPGELQIAEETAVSANADLKTEEEEEIKPAEIPSVPEETGKEKSILQKAAGLKDQGKYLIAYSLYSSAAQNMQNMQSIKDAEFQMLDCLLLAGLAEDAARVMFGILNKKYDLTAQEKLRIKETMTVLQNADRQKSV